MAKVRYTARHRLCLPGKSGEIYRLGPREFVDAEDGELDAFPTSFKKEPIPKKKRHVKKTRKIVEDDGD